MRPEDVGGVHIRYLHHCHRQLWLYLRGIRPEHLSATVARGAVLHYPKTRRTKKIAYGAEEVAQAEADINATLAVGSTTTSPPRLARTACRGCSFFDYCWSE
jgi:CRISPR/Cas system-associated exonuclease Cas4 (RecB family)